MAAMIDTNQNAARGAKNVIGTSLCVVGGCSGYGRYRHISRTSTEKLVIQY